MPWDRDDARARAKTRDRVLTRYLRHEIAAYCDAHRRRMLRAGVEPKELEGLAGLRRLPVLDWDDVAADPGGFLLRPEEGDIARHGDRPLVVAITWAKLRGRADRVNRDVVDPRYKPIQWHLDHGVPIGSTDHDLDRLGVAGARMFDLAGLGRYDVVVGVHRPGPVLGYWQTVLGARQAGLSAIHLGDDADPETVAAAGPSALAGDRAGLVAALERLDRAGITLDGLHTVVVTGERLDAAARDQVAMAAEAVAERPDELAVVAAWAPRGVRALWAECRGGPGFHTYPDLEVLEVQPSEAAPKLEGSGELVWSALGWHGTALVRVRTGVAARLVDQKCPACGRVGPMVLGGDRRPEGASRALAAHPDVSVFQVELRRVNGEDEVLVFLALERGAPVPDVLSDLDRSLRATQYVVLGKADVKRRVARSGRVVDERER